MYNIQRIRQPHKKNSTQQKTIQTITQMLLIIGLTLFHFTDSLKEPEEEVGFENHWIIITTANNTVFLLLIPRNTAIYLESQVILDPTQKKLYITPIYRRSYIEILLLISILFSYHKERAYEWSPTVHSTIKEHKYF